MCNMLSNVCLVYLIITFVLLFGLTNLGKPISTIRKINGDKNGDE